MLTTDSPKQHGFAKADICILGAGPAGITLALELAQRRKKVVLLEAGLVNSPGEKGLDSYNGENTGRPYPIAGSRIRYFGGTSNHWGGWCRPLDPAVFAEPLGDAVEGWPLEESDIRPWYDKAASYCQLSSSSFDVQENVERSALLELDGFDTRLFRFSPPTRFGQVYNNALANDENIGVFLGWTAKTLFTSPATGQVAAVAALDTSGSETRIEADDFVVAMGGIENARFLLLQQQRFGGLLPDNPTVGRSFMDHFGFTPGKALLSELAKYFRYDSDTGPLMPVLVRTVGKDTQHKNRVAIQLSPSVSKGMLGAGYLSPLSAPQQRSPSAEYSVVFIVEPTPNDASSITLSERRDAFGMRRAIMNWAIKDDDFEAVRQTIRELAVALGVSTAGRLWQRKAVNAKTTQSVGVGFHHMGTTRMSKTDAGGVTDHDCRIWGVPNLYVAGSSLFPRVGYSNPTLAIIALTSRLADHLTRGEPA